MKFDQKIFDLNIDLYKQKDPLFAHQLEFIHHFNEIKFCKTNQNELNLFKKQLDFTTYYHSQKGALDEAKEIVKNEIKKETDVIYFYGLGLAYVYDAIKDWLKEKNNRHIVFLEDDPEVIHHFFFTDRATALLQDPQVTLFHFSDLNIEFDSFYRLLTRFTGQRFQFFVLLSYVQTRSVAATNLCYRIFYNQSWIEQLIGEYMSGQYGFYLNFYRNLLNLPDSYLGTNLFGKFNQIPAIICGAGPSLEKNIEVLKKLSNHALIFAGGSSLNAVNNFGIIPHFGLGIDPNKEQLHRLISNHIYHIPFFYRNRLSHDAFDLIQGPKIYVPGSITSLSEWFEEKLDLPGKPLDEGHNVINFCTEIATSLGCNPIIFVGVDLAFEEKKTYAKGIDIHPLWLGESKPYSMDHIPSVVPGIGINGEKITTRWEWLAEAQWISKYAQNHPNIKFINASEGGLGFPNIPNTPLSEVAKTYMGQQYDLLTKVLGEILNSPITFLKFKIIQTINEFKISLERSLDYCLKINQNVMNTSNSIYYESLLKEEPSYQFYLKMIDKLQFFLDEINSDKVDFLDTPQKKKHRLLILVSIIRQHINVLVLSVKNDIFLSTTSSNITENIKVTEGTYEFKNHELIIQDSNLNISIKTTFTPTEKSEYYPNNTLKFSSFYNENNQLQGPSRYFSEEGQLLAESWFFQGKRVGESKAYHKSGTLYSIQRYKDDLLEGKQEFYYPNGSLHIETHYKHGCLDGDVKIYEKNGALKREIQYQSGKRYGLERAWYPNGKEMMECHYHEGQPIETAKHWNSLGKLIKEVTIYQYPNDFDSTEWNINEQIIKTIKHGHEDYSHVYTKTGDQIEALSKGINSIIDTLEPMLLNTNGNPVDKDFLSELESIKKSAQEMAKLKEELDIIRNTKSDETDPS